MNVQVYFVFTLASGRTAGRKKTVGGCMCETQKVRELHKEPLDSRTMTRLDCQSLAKILKHL